MAVILVVAAAADRIPPAPLPALAQLTAVPAAVPSARDALGPAGAIIDSVGLASRARDLPVIACLLAPEIGDRELVERLGWQGTLEDGGFAGRPRPAETGRLRCGGIEVDLLTRIVRQKGRSVVLAPREFSLLSHFIRHEGEILSRMDLLRTVWNYAFDPETNVVEVHISRLRRKIDFAASGLELATLKGEGYRLTRLATA